ncbi:hypothetical protein Hypma_005343 [Hypsizygus marmoreus]|uniref:Uncharacterized protein n=1 Tax=Hypsizygus marmoreus TaxID=39966 RepID=A0A369K4W7_HYPMA|nr:hypothetical protein Hypma_005343 [Hypsizygus marmoreus]
MYTLPFGTNIRSFLKLRAVYPQWDHTLQQVADHPAPELIHTLKDRNRWPFLRHLGSMKRITCPNPDSVSKEILPFTGAKGPWPLIYRVQIQCNSPALSTGVTLVDLPGLGDSNIARCSVTESYIKTADHFFTVLPITRAVDAQITSELLGASKLQLKPSRHKDGTFNSSKLTFVVTKCDDISWEEVARSMQLEDDLEFAQLYNKFNECQQNTTYLEEKHQEACNECRRYEEEPSSSFTAPSKWANAEGTDTDDIGGKRSLSDSNDAPAAKRIKVAWKTHEVQEHELFHQLNQVRERLKVCQEQERMAQYALRAFCSQKRSEETSAALSEKIMEEMEDDFGDTAGMFPVFTVATRDYQKIDRRMSGETTCFLDVTDTKIPALQDHCRVLARRVREDFALASFEMLSRTISSMYRAFKGIERADDKDLQLLSITWGEQHGRIRNGPKSLEERLRRNFVASRDKTIEALKERFKDGLEDTCAAAAEEAIAMAVPTAQTLQQEIVWQQLRAIFRRDGAGIQNINETFAKPFLEEIEESWRLTLDHDFFPQFQDDIQTIIDNMIRELVKTCRSASFRERAEAQATNAARETKQALSHLQKRVKSKLNEDQKGVSRTIISEVQLRLTEGYAETLEIQGRGSVAMQNEFFQRWLKWEKHTIFGGLKDSVLNGLDSTAREIDKTIWELLENLAEKVHAEMSLLWENKPKQTPEFLRMKKEVKRWEQQLSARLQEDKSRWRGT